MPGTTQALSVAEPSHIGSAVRAATNRAKRLGFDGAGVSNIAAVAAELAEILARDARRGRLLIGTLAEGDSKGLDLLALDRGSGMGEAGARLCRRSVDGDAEDYGAVARFATRHEIYSTPGHGTALLARFRERPKNIDLAPLRFEVGRVCVPMPGESVSGDDWCVESIHDRAVLMLADGLGHGPAAHEAASAATKTARVHHTLAPGAIIRLAHEALRSTRGAALAVAEIDASTRTLTYCGVGNIAGMVVTPFDVHGLVSQYGTVGQGSVRLQEFVYPFPADALLVMHSDGLKTTWNMDRFPGLPSRHPGLVAAALYSDFEHGHDDTTVIVLRHAPVLP